MPTINPARVRYIKLGEKGIWEKECLDKSMIRTGLDGATAERFPLCSARQWDELMRSFYRKRQDPENSNSLYQRDPAVLRGRWFDVVDHFRRPEALVGATPTKPR